MSVPYSRAQTRAGFDSVTAAGAADGNELRRNECSNQDRGRRCRCRVCKPDYADYRREYRSRPVEPDKHGTAVNYARGCRCEACRTYHAARRREYVERKRLAVARGDNVKIPHGRNGYANHSCRCDVCRAANAAAHREYMARRRGKYRATPPRRTPPAGDMRTWARARGYLVADRGALPRDVIQAYAAAHAITTGGAA